MVPRDRHDRRLSPCRRIWALAELGHLIGSPLRQQTKLPSSFSTLIGLLSTWLRLPPYKSQSSRLNKSIRYYLTISLTTEHQRVP
jgi:hypothetical protein